VREKGAVYEHSEVGGKKEKQCTLISLTPFQQQGLNEGALTSSGKEKLKN